MFNFFGNFAANCESHANATFCKPTTWLLWRLISHGNPYWLLLWPISAAAFCEGVFCYGLFPLQNVVCLGFFTLAWEFVPRKFHTFFQLMSFSRTLFFFKNNLCSDYEILMILWIFRIIYKIWNVPRFKQHACNDFTSLFLQQISIIHFN